MIQPDRGQHPGKTEHVQNMHVLVALRLRADALRQLIGEMERHRESLELAIALCAEGEP